MKENHRNCHARRHLVGIHTHNDAGVAVANALASVNSGATQVQGTVNGYGNVGNCNLTTVIPNLQLKMDRPVIEDVSRLTPPCALR